MLRPLHVFIGFCLVIFGALYYYAAQQDKHYSANAELYLENALAEISRWKPEDLRSHLAPAARDAVTEEQLSAVVEQYKPLGKFISLDTPQFSKLTAALSIFSGGKGGGLRLGYSFPARFENGQALVTATLQVDQGHFSLYNFSIRRQNPAAEHGSQGSGGD